jgi:hypothetical protein
MAKEAGARPRRRFQWWLRWSLVFLPWVILGYEIALLIPVYFNYVKVSRSLDQVAAAFHEGDDPESLPRGIAQHFQTEGVVKPEAKDISVTRDGSQWLLEASYDHDVPILFGLRVVVSFDKIAHAGTAGP